MFHSEDDDEEELDFDPHHSGNKGRGGGSSKKQKILTSAESPLGSALQPAYDERSRSGNSESRGSSESNSPRHRSGSSQEKGLDHPFLERVLRNVDLVN